MSTLGNIVMLINIIFITIIGLNVQTVEAGSKTHPESGPADSKDLKVRRIVQEMSSDQLGDQQYHQHGSIILNEQLKWLGGSEIYDGTVDNTPSVQNKGIFDDTLIPIPSKKSGTSRLCGTKLVDAIVKLCNGCVKPAGGKAVSAKRCEFCSYFITAFW